MGNTCSVMLLLDRMALNFLVNKLALLEETYNGLYKVSHYKNPVLSKEDRTQQIFITIYNFCLQIMPITLCIQVDTCTLTLLE